LARAWAPVALLAILASLALQVLTLSDGHGWGGDFALYVLHARNLAEGRAYTDTGYVVNPLNRWHSPSSYPPVYPSLLAPLYAKWGLNYTPFKALNAVCLAVGLWFLYLLSLNAGAPPALGALLVLLSGTSPCLWRLRNEVVPEMAYLMFAMAALWWHVRCDRRNERGCLSGLLTGALCALAFGTHNLGLTLGAAVLLTEFWRRRLTPYLAGAGLAFAAIALLLGLASPSSSDYLRMFHPDLGMVKRNVVEYVRYFALLYYGVPKTVQYLLLAGATGLALAGAWRLRRSASLVVIVYALICSGLLAVWPAANGLRYIVSLIPLYLFLAIAGAVWLRRGWRYSVHALAAATMFCGAAQYASMARNPISEGVRQPEFQALAAFLRQKAARQDLVVFWNPRVLALYTGGSATTYAPNLDAERNWEEFRRMGVRYIAVNKSYSDDKVLRSVLAAHSASVERVYENAGYLVDAVARTEPASAR
jgi:hypothetical protein